VTLSTRLSPTVDGCHWSALKCWNKQLYTIKCENPQDEVKITCHENPKTYICKISVGKNYGIITSKSVKDCVEYMSYYSSGMYVGFSFCPETCLNLFEVHIN
jgi:hypothetical protein